MLPRLCDGVVLHFHDVFLPDEYPRDWVEGLAFLNKQYLLAAFLLFNERFEVLALTHHLAATQRPALARFELNLSPEQVEDHEERSLRDFPLLLDRCAHVS